MSVGLKGKNGTWSNNAIRKPQYWLMKKTIPFLLLILSFSPVFCQTENVQSPAREKIGSDFVQALFVDSDFGKAHASLAPIVTAQLSVDLLGQTIRQITAQLGKLQHILDVNHEKDDYYFYLAFEKTKMDLKMTFDRKDKIAGFFLVPHKVFDKKTENTLNIKSGAIELKGTFLHPDRNKLKKLVIFVHGSGPHDRDETIGENKPFKDMADYFFGQGIASYRFDKRTFSHPLPDAKITPEEEIVADVANVVDHFREQHPDCEIVLLGHSLGGYLLPEIYRKAGSKVSKLVFLAANARSLDELVLEQMKYLYQLGTGVSAAQIAEMERQVEYLHSVAFDVSTPREKLPLGNMVSTEYWQYLLAYKPLDLVKSATVPLFFAQGGKDYQVTEQDFDLWKQHAPRNDHNVFKFYPSLNHLMMPSDGVPSPNDYLKKGNVSGDLLQDLTDFIQSS